MEQDSLLLIVAVVAVAVAIIGVGVTYNSVGIFKNFFTGFVAEENGTVSVEVQTNAVINITSANNTIGSKTLDWGAGAFIPGADYALLVSNGTVVNGTWANITQGFIVENIGNQNVSLSISATSDASTFLGGSSPLFQYNMSNSEAESCTFEAGIENTYNDFSTTPVSVCSKFLFDAAKDEIIVDVLLKLPIDVKTGALTNTVILTYEAV